MQSIRYYRGGVTKNVVVRYYNDYGYRAMGNLGHPSLPDIFQLYNLLWGVLVDWRIKISRHSE